MLFYSLLIFFQKGKAIDKTVLANLNFESYLNVLMRDERIMSEHYTLSSDKHLIYMKKVKKMTLTSFDNKRKMMSCGIHTYAFGNINTPYDNMCECNRKGGDEYLP